MGKVKDKEKRDVAIKVGPKWTIITVRVPTVSLAAQGASQILGKKKGRQAFRNLRKKAKAREAGA